MKRSLLLIPFLLSLAPAQSVAGQADGLAATLRGIQEARREVIAALPVVGRQDVAAALKAAAAKGTKVFVIAERRTLGGGGYLLNVSHGPSSVFTYLVPSIPMPWVIVDGAWVASGLGLDRQTGGISVNRDARALNDLSAWARSVTQAGPVKRTELLRLHLRR